MLAVGGVADAAPLLRPAGQTALSVEKREQLAADPYVMRWREARMAVDGVFDPSAWDEPLALNLFPDAELEARVRSAKTLESGSQFLSGRLVGGGRFTLFRSAGGVLRGEFHSAAGVFTMRSLGPRRVLVKQQDISKLSRCNHDATLGEAGPRPDRQGVGDGTRAQPLSRPSLHQHRPDEMVDILVVYTPNAERSEGGRAEIEATIEAEVEKTNQAFVNSGLSHREIKLAGLERVEYTQSTEDIVYDLSYLYAISKLDTFDPEGLLDEVHDLRKKYAADMVHLIVEKSVGRCGGAFAYGLNRESGLQKFCADKSDVDSCMRWWRKYSWRRLPSFSVSAIPEGCRVQNVFTHELGHSFGLKHDRYSYRGSLSLTDPAHFPYTPYGFGYVNQNFGRSECSLTIMASGRQCIDEDYPWVVPELMFSSPDLQLGSDEVGYDPAGVAGEEWTTDLDGPVNASRHIDDVWDLVANLYHSSTAGSDRLFSGEAELLSADEAALDLADYYFDRRGWRSSALTYSATVDNPDLASVSVVGSILTVTANEDGEEGVVTVTATVTGEAGQTETLRFEVTISPRAPDGWRGWRTTLATPTDGA